LVRIGLAATYSLIDADGKDRRDSFSFCIFLNTDLLKPVFGESGLLIIFLTYYAVNSGAISTIYVKESAILYFFV